MKNYCENKYCIYFDRGQCLLDFISLDRCGVCLDAIMFDIDDEILHNKRKERRGEYERLDKT